MSIPIKGNGGENYGLCGLEISNLLFSLRFPAVESKYGEITTAIAPVSENKILLSSGLVGQRGVAYLNGVDEFDFEGGGGLYTYKTGNQKYIGMHRIVNGAKNEAGKDWAIIVFVSYNDYYKQLVKQRMKVIFAIAIFVPIILLVAFILSHHFVKPIVEGLEELFDSFIDNSKKLTASEHNIMMYYANGYEIADVPDLACISLNTVRKHNRSIYEKLNVKSNDELRLYTDLLKRCGRIGELDRTSNTEE